MKRTLDTLDPSGILSPGKSGIWNRDVSEVMPNSHL